MTGSNYGGGVWRAVIWIMVAAVGILSLGAFLTLRTLTLVNWWWPVAGAFAVAAASGTVLWRIWRRPTGSESFWPNFLVNLLFFAILLTGAFYSLNAAFVSNASPRKERVKVEEKYRERHHTSRRVGKHSYVAGPDYFEYYVGVCLPAGCRRNLRLPYSVYRSINKDSLLTLSLRRGLFGPEVICTADIPADNPSMGNERKKRRCRFFGTSSRRSDGIR